MIRRRLVCSLVLGLALSGCAESVQVGEGETARDLAVYAAVLSEQRVRGYNVVGQPIEYLVLYEQTDCDVHDLAQYLAADAVIPKSYATELPTLQLSCLRNLAEQNQEPGLLTGLVADIPVKLVARSRQDEFWEPGAGTEIHFWDLYPNSTGFMNISRVGYSEGFDQALVYCDSTQGGLSGGGFLVLLVNDGGWHVKAFYDLWVS